MLKRKKWQIQGHPEKDPIKSASSRIRRLFRDVVSVDASGRNKVNALGFNSFELSHTPVWCYFEYILESRILIAEKEIKMFNDKINHISEKSEKDKLLNLIKEKTNQIKQTTKTVNILRNVFGVV